jgi:hypothetical protein
MHVIVKKCFRDMNRRLALIEKSERSTTMAHDASQGRRLLRMMAEDIARELYPDSYENMQTFIRECEETDK